MISKERARKKWIAAFFSGLLVVQNFYPAAVYALTSGPTQPEMQKFQPAGANDLVDLFTGDFKYDIPLMDVGGYPLNLSYHSGTGMEDEASWVGAGWTLNPGSVNRSMRGLPDDFTGDNADGDPQDAVRTVQHQKDYKKIGAQLTVKKSAFGFAFGSASLHLDVHKDNYWGIGAAIGGGVNFTLDQTANASLTAGLTLNSDNRNGVTVSPNLQLTANTDGLKETNSGSLSGGFAYNTRSGLEEVDLGASFSSVDRSFDDYGNQTGQGSGGMDFASFNKHFAHTYTPTNNFNTTHKQSTFSFDLGPTFFGGYLGVGGSGYVFTQTNAEPSSILPAYGYMHYTAGTHNPAALLDFNREKDGVFNTFQPAIPIPVSTEDYFVATSQAGMQQFRPVYNGNYVVYDHPYTDKSSTISAGATVGAGNAFQVGAQLNVTSAQSVTHEWTTNNGYVTALMPGGSSDPRYENVYFKQAGEQTRMSTDFYNAIGKDVTQKVVASSHVAGGPATINQLVSAAGNFQTVTPMNRGHRDVRTSTFSYLTALQARTYGLDKTINESTNGSLNATSRVDDPTGITDPDFQCIHKAHHISEVTVTDKEGKRMVYGIPVYNRDKEEVSFSVQYPGTTPEGQSDLVTNRRTGLVNYGVGTDNSASNTKGRYNIFNRKSIPPYTTSFLLTGILSPDYVDKTGDGISDDDLGTAIKFNYTRLGIYNWRAPFEQTMANYNEGFLSDHQDDKASYEYGTKDVWYLNTIQTRTLVAVFYTSPRQDGLGVTDENNSGGKNTSLLLQKLDKIALYSRADYQRNSTNAVPIKVVHFEYDYSLFPGIPNTSTAGGGKLTLKKVYFTFGNSSRGQTNPYLFTYDSGNPIGGGAWGTSPFTGESNDTYAQRQTDRWGTYRQSYFTTPAHLFYNSDFPYALQPFNGDPYDVRQLADRFASKWQLTGITTPTGAVLTVGYESDDYSYVQDRKAMMMCPVVGVGRSATAGTMGSSGMVGADMIYVKVPVAPTSVDDFKSTYLSGPDGQQPWNNFAYKMLTNLDGRNALEYVYGYAEIDYAKNFYANGSNIVGIPVLLLNNKTNNPISVAAWQMIQTDLPQFAYPNYDNSNVDNLSGSVTAAVKSIVTAFANLRELFESFDQLAAAKGYGDKFDPTRSLVRLNFPVGKAVGSGATKTYGKLGGGARVNKVTISDNWAVMNAAGDAKTMNYGVMYDYTILNDAGNLISSGVASYEPQIGNEENPFHQPVTYTEKVEWSNDRYHTIETPFGESYFPSASVGYSQVKATAFGGEGGSTATPATNTGYILSQFYTARDFPTQADYLPLEEDTYEYDLTLLLFGSKYTNRVTTSQGFKVTVNDMHGKAKSTQTYDANKQLISETDYLYNVVDANAQQKQLNNTVLAMCEDGSIPATGTLIATDADIITDVRESKNTSSGTAVDANAGGFFAFGPWPFAGFNYAQTGSLTSYNSIASVKVIHQYGLVKEVRTTQNGSTLTADNLLWDAQTGDVLLTRNQNEFQDYTYAVHYPAFRAYNGMGSAYENIGAVYASPADADGTITPTYQPYLSPGDELVDIDAGMIKKGWVLQSGDGSLRLIDQAGNFLDGTGLFMVIRSGRRNLLSAGGGTVVTMSNPLMLGGSGYVLQAGVDQKVLDAKALTYKDEWGIPVPNVMSNSPLQCPPVENLVSHSLPPGCYMLSNLGIDAPVCDNSLFGAAIQPTHTVFGTTVEPTRGFVNFGSPIAQLPPDAIIQSVHLSLFSNPAHPQSTDGTNAAYLKRELNDPGCGGNWNSQSLTTENNKVLLPASTSTTQDYPNIDITGMFTDWFATNPGASGKFAIAIELVTETPDHTSQLIFDGAAGARPYQLQICFIEPNQCISPVNQLLNPYFQGVKGNWRPEYNYVYQVTRNQAAGDPAQNGGTNIRNTGYYSSFTPFYIPTVAHGSSPSTLIPIASMPGSPGNVSDARWVWSSRSVYYDQKGNEVENVDPLKRYNSVQFGYQQSLATAVASNARHSEVAFDGFEDYYFALQTDPNPCPLSQRQWDFGIPAPSTGQLCNGGNCIVNTKAHSGNYSMQLGGNIIFQPAYANADPPTSILGFDVNGRAILLANEQASGFAPIANKPYVLSLWVNDGAPTTKTFTGLNASINNQNQNLSTLPAAAVVEGWKLLNLTIPAGTFKIELDGGTNVFIDDVRLFPFDAEMKSFVYDDQTLRLMAQLDENNFAIFYEYDREGTPIRVKKETEKGIMTVKENRQSLITH